MYLYSKVGLLLKKNHSKWEVFIYHEQRYNLYMLQHMESHYIDVIWFWYNVCRPRSNSLSKKLKLLGNGGQPLYCVVCTERYRQSLWQLFRQSRTGTAYKKALSTANLTTIEDSNTLSHCGKPLRATIDRDMSCR